MKMLTSGEGCPLHFQSLINLDTTCFIYTKKIGLDWNAQIENKALIEIFHDV